MTINIAGRIYFKSNFHFLPTLIAEFLFKRAANSPISKYLVNIIACNAIKIKTPNSLTKVSTISTKWLLIPVEKSNDPQHAMIAKIVTPFLRDQLNLSQTDTNKGSNNANDEVNPANNIDKNSNGAIILPTGPITSNISGRTIKIKLVPSLINSVIGIELVTDIYPKMENIPNPTNIS